MGWDHRLFRGWPDVGVVAVRCLKIGVVPEERHEVGLRLWHVILAALRLLCYAQNETDIEYKHMHSRMDQRAI